MFNFDCVVIGAGISGITATIYLKRANLNVCLIDCDAPGGMLNKIKSIKNYPGLTNISGPDFAYKLYEQLTDLDISVKYGKVLDVDSHIVKTDREEITANKIIIATGRPTKRIKDTDGVENISYCALCDGTLYKEKDIALIGENTEAIEDAIYLSGLCSSLLFICDNNIYEQAKERLIKYENITILNNMNYKLNIENNVVTSIIVDKEYKIAGIFANLGHMPKTDFVKNIKTDNGYIIVNKDMQTSNENIYACGDVILKDVYQLTTSASEGTIAAINVKKCISEER